MTDRSSGFIVAVVDDDQSVLRSLEYLLESADYAARLFTSAMALLESGGLNEVDCLISDIDMPGMDGVDPVERIHAARPGLRTILITGYRRGSSDCRPSAESMVLLCAQQFPLRGAQPLLVHSDQNTPRRRSGTAKDDN